MLDFSDSSSSANNFLLTPDVLRIRRRNAAIRSDEPARSLGTPTLAVSCLQPPSAMTDSSERGARGSNGQTKTKLSKDEFIKRFDERFFDPAFDAVRRGDGGRPRRRMGRLRRLSQGSANPTGRRRVRRSGPSALDRMARRASRDSGCPAAPRGSTGQTSYSRGLRKRAHRSDVSRRDVEDVSARRNGKGRRRADDDCECDFLDLSALTAEYGRVIYPCKGCVSTAMPLCHWPCSCYPELRDGPGQRLDA